MNDEHGAEPIRASRNDSLGFAQRTLRNLEHIENFRNTGGDVHVVTQRIISLLGLVAFPWHAGLSDHIKTQKLEALAQNGWPEWNVSLGSAETLGDLVHHLRNAIAHRRVYFSSDDREGANVEVVFEDAKKENLPVYWRAQINSDGLLDFCRKFVDLVENVIG